MSRQDVSLVWFKRDLRLTDHLPLQKAIESGNELILLYCFDPKLINDPHYNVRHWRFCLGISTRHECQTILNQTPG